MALGVMLVVAVLLIVGVVDQSFQSNSSLGYDTIVGAKGGKLQLTLNTVYYLSNPVENLPYAFYQEYLPAEARDETANDGKADVHYLNQVEFERNGKWHRSEGQVAIPAGEMSVRLRIPLLQRSAVEVATVSLFDVTSSVPGQVEEVLVSEGEQVSAGEVLLKLKSAASVDDDNAEATTGNLVLDSGATLEDPNEKRFKLRLEVTSADNLNNTFASATATLLTQADDSITPEVAPTASEFSDGTLAKKTTLKVNSVKVQPTATHAVFVARIFKPINTDVTFRPQLIDGFDGKYVPYLAPDKISAIPVCLGDFFGQFRVVGTTADFFRMVYDVDDNKTYEFAEGGNFTGQGEHGVFEAIIGAKVAREKGVARRRSYSAISWCS